METSKSLMSPVVPLAVLLMAALVLLPPASADIETACTTSLVTSFAPCLFYLTGGGSGIWSTAPTDDCCDAFGELIRRGAECGCLILTGNVPFGLPINQTLAITLPGACSKSKAVPLQCRDTATPLPPPGPVPFGSGPGLPPFRNWPSLLPPPPPLPLPARPFKTLPAAPAAAPSDSMRMAREEFQPLDFPTSAAEPSSIYSASLLVPAVAIGAMLLSRF